VAVEEEAADSVAEAEVSAAAVREEAGNP